MKWQVPNWGDRPVFWALVAVSVPTTAAAVYWISKKTIHTLVPYEYHYRPGTISGWFANILHNYSDRRRKIRPIRVYMDGCFDMMHYGHANALRQARACGDELVVGLIPDSEIVKNKGPPVMNDDERYVMVESVKWVDEVMKDVPYDLTPEFVNKLFTKYKIDYIIHGDDPCLLPDGTDAYAYPKQLGRFRMIKRTEGVSTTDIVGRMLTCTRVNPLVGTSSERNKLTRQFSRSHSKSGDEELSSSEIASKFLPTSRRLVQFSNGRVVPAGGTIVYVDGAFDVLHPGHVELLMEARKQGDFLLVGLHTDEDVGRRRGPHLPIMNLHERSLSVLACKYVDEVVIGAPSVITEDLLKTFNINLVVRGTKSETAHLEDSDKDRYSLPKTKGIYKQLSSPSSMTTSSIIRRIMDRRTEYEARQARKTKSEAAYLQNKVYVSEI